MVAPTIDRRAVATAALALVGLGLALYAPGLGARGFWAPDEPRYAQVAREMLVDGHWRLPHLDGELYVHKPPLFFWLIAIASTPVGDVVPAVARWVSVLSALATLLATAALGARVYGPRAGVMAAVCLATAARFWWNARYLQIDMLLTLLVTLTVVAFERVYRGSSHRRLWLGVLYAAPGLATLSKGPVGLIVPALALVAYRLIDRPTAARERHPVRPWALAVTTAIPLAWLAAAALGDGGYAPGDVLRTHVLERFSEGMHHRRPPYYFVQTLAVDLFPWSLLVPAALVDLWRRRHEGRPELALAPAWLGTTFLFFSLSAEKRGVYLLPAFPAAALVVGALWDRLLSGLTTLGATAIRVPLAVAGVALAGVGVAAGVTGSPTDSLRVAAVVVGVTLAIAGLAVVVTALRSTLSTAWATLVAALAAVYLVLALIALPAVDPYKSDRPLAERIDELVPADSIVAIYGSHRSAGPLFYVGQRLEVVPDPGALQALLTAGEPAVCIVRTGDHEDLEELGFDWGTARLLEPDPLRDEWLVVVDGATP